MQLENNKQADLSKLCLMIGQLIESNKRTSETISCQTIAIQSLSKQVNESAAGFARLEAGLTKANDDIMSLRKSVLTPDGLRPLGIKIDEASAHKRDFDYLRELRESADERKIISRPVITHILTAVIMAALMWIGQSLWISAKRDIARPEPRQHIAQQDRRND